MLAESAFAIAYLFLSRFVRLADVVGWAAFAGWTLPIGLVMGLVSAFVNTRWVENAAVPLVSALKSLHERGSADRLGLDANEGFAPVSRALDELSRSMAKTLSDLRAERDLLSSVLSGMLEGVLLLDADGRIVLMNRALREMLLLRADAVGKSLLEVVRSAELQDLLDRARVAAEPTSREVEWGGLKPRRLLARVTPLDHERQGTLAVFVDVTELRRLESMRRDFVANVSHELRTPVTSIRSASETLASGALNDPQFAHKFLDIIERNAERLHRLIEDLLELSKIESREFVIHRTTFDLSAFCAHVVALFRDLAEKKRVKVLVDVPPDVELSTDRRALEQIVTNLVDNAVKYAGEHASVTLGARVHGETVTMTVSDTGPGIEPEHLERIFERFYRVDPGRSRDVGGTGLGLSIVKHLSEALGGTIQVKSAVGRGTTFTLTLPRSGR